LLRALYFLGLHRLARFLFRGKLVILAYHGFTGKSEHEGIENHQGKHLHIEKFRSHIKYLKENYNIISIDEVIDYYRKGSPLPRNPVVITIDDGYESAYTMAFPVLEELNAPCALFLTTNFVDKREPLWVDRLEYAVSGSESDSLEIDLEGSRRSFSLRDRVDRIRCETEIRSIMKSMPVGTREDALDKLEDELGVRLTFDGSPEIYRPLKWRQVLEMAESGIVTMGSHTRNHIILTRAEPAIAGNEVDLSKRLIEERTGLECRAFCYPNGGIGDFDRATRRALEKAGYSCALLNVPGFNGRRSDPLELRRFGFSKEGSLAELAMAAAGIARIPGMLKACLARRASRPQEDSVIEKFDSGAGGYSDKYSGSGPEAHSFTVRRKRVCELLEDRKGGKALDIGCGPGVMARHLTDRGFEFYGVDISSEMISRCKEDFAPLRNARFSVGRVEKLNFPDSFFDVVLCMGVVEYIEDDEDAVKEISRVAKRGATVIITLPNRTNPYRSWHRVVFNRKVIGLIKRLAGRKGPTLRHREYREKEYKDLLARYGLDVVDTVYYNFNLFLAPLDRLLPGLSAALSRKLERFCRGGMRKLGTGFIVKALRR
jgi:ubiquinone/menaquinone biosynthesis C-methylase UbiE/peptidoglycan/xylan/chitin deacetylase (PgdA/CDA1 family)